MEYIKKGVPIIYHGILHDYRKKIYGIPDLLVRFDYLGKLFNSECHLNNISEKIKNKYVVIEIKYTSLHLYSDGIHINNSNKKKSSLFCAYVFMKYHYYIISIKDV